MARLLKLHMIDTSSHVLPRTISPICFCSEQSKYYWGLVLNVAMFSNGDLMNYLSHLESLITGYMHSLQHSVNNDFFRIICSNEYPSAVIGSQPTFYLCYQKCLGKKTSSSQRVY